MVKRYSKRQIERIMEACEDWIDTVAAQIRLPAPCIRAVLRRELGEMDLLDPVADAAVRFYWFRYRLRKPLYRAGLLHSPLPGWRRGFLGKRDSSTGYGQIFAYVAIAAANYGVDRGLIRYDWLGLERRMDPDSPEDLCRMWRLLHRDWQANIALSALNLLAAGEEVNGHADFSRYTPEQLQLAFTRYNANVRHITGYGRAVYDLYLNECEKN